MGLISRVSSRTYRFFLFYKMAEVETKMAEENWAEEDLAVEQEDTFQEPLLFGKWALSEVKCNDLSLQDYINFKGNAAKHLPHSSGRFNKVRFRKAQCPIVERLINSFMIKGRNNGKKLLSMRIVRHTFEIIHIMTGGPREDSTRIGRAGSVRRQACDVSPMRRVNQ